MTISQSDNADVQPRSAGVTGQVVATYSLLLALRGFATLILMILLWLALDSVAQRHLGYDRIAYWIAATLLTVAVAGFAYSRANKQLENTFSRMMGLLMTDDKSKLDFDLPQTIEAIQKLNVEQAIALIKFYEDSASTVKTRTWTITTWVLTISVGLLAYAFKLYTDHSTLPGFLLLELAITVVGVALSLFLIILIVDQGNHLRHYWTNENRIAAWNRNVRGLVLDPPEYRRALQEDYSAPFPRFCVRLRLLAVMFAVAFIAAFAMFGLVR